MRKDRSPAKESLVAGAAGPPDVRLERSCAGVRAGYGSAGACPSGTWGDSGAVPDPRDGLDAAPTCP